MGIHNQDKLNSLQRSLPEGLIVDAGWLERHGYSRALRKKYVTRGWLDQVVRGVYRRPAPKLQESLRWQAVVISLQTLLGRPYTVGGRTALELQGFALLRIRGVTAKYTPTVPANHRVGHRSCTLRTSSCFTTLAGSSKPIPDTRAGARAAPVPEMICYRAAPHNAAMGTVGMAADVVIAGTGDP